jgi:predicted outer membrane repeat protein
VGVCDDLADACLPSPVPNGIGCEEGNLCTAGDSCQAGTCIAGPAVSCDDASVCTIDTCDPRVGCVASPVNCNDGDLCTIDTCDPGSGCQSTPDSADSDSDGTADVCDVCPDDAGDDVDLDGVCADVDNCPDVFNPEQVNRDGDTLGDVCDPDSKHVSTTSSCPSPPGGCGNCGSSSFPYSSIQDAINCWGDASGRPIIVHPGTYLENINLAGKKLNLQSLTGPEDTIIEGTGTDPTVLLGPNGNSTITGLTIRNSGSGNGIFAASTQVHIVGNVITGIDSSYKGAAIHLETLNSSDITDNTITANSATQEGGGIYIRSAIVSVQGNRIQNNSSTLSGGGLHVRTSVVQITENLFEGNVAGTSGGGIAVDSSTPTIEDNLLSDNRSSQHGGGLYLTGASSIVRRNSLELNASLDGAGLYAELGALTLESNRFEGNLANGVGGAIALRAVPDPATSSSPSVVSNNLILTGAAGLSGGGLWCGQGSWIDVTNNTVFDNAAGFDGGGIFVGDCTVSITNNIVVNSPLGEGIYCEATATADLSFNDVWSNVGGDFGGVCLQGEGGISADPLFVGGSCGTDLHIVPGSSVLDSGSNGAPALPAQDMDGDPRILDGDFDGFPQIDMGADEFNCLDRDGDGFTRCTIIPDCDDANADVNPFASEACDGVDNDCDCLIDEDFGDADGDGFSVCAGDCDDGDPFRNPAELEVCDEIDNDCDGSIDEGFIGVCDPGAELVLSEAIGLPGDTVGITASLALLDAAAAVSATANDITYNTGLFGAPVCTINPAIGLGSLPDKQLSQSFPSAGVLRVAILSLNSTPIPAGDLYTCAFDISAGAAAGTFALLNTASASAPDGSAVPTSSVSGSITVLPGPGTTPLGPIGDCDGSDLVSIDEVQTAINIFLSVQPVGDCPAADANGDGIVDIVELQNAINNLLGL